jgi:hypothetical protein
VVLTLAVLISGADAPRRPEVEPDASPTFSEVVEAHFAEWDLNGDGRLESTEIDRLMNRTEIQGEEAAAIATIKRRERATLNFERSRYAASREQLVKGVGTPEPIDPAEPSLGLRIIPDEAVFRHHLRALGTLNRNLFAGDGPNFRAMRQGPIGDCYFFSMTGYLAAREPKRIKQMISLEPDGSYLVRFFDGERVRVPAPTDAEILLNNSSSSLADGIWLPVLEKALGEKMRRKIPASVSRRSDEATDAMAAGGTTGLIIQLYSGHRDTEIRLRESRYRRARLDLLRRVLPQILARGMLAGAEMGASPPEGWPKVPDLGYRHAYAILGFDPASDRIMLWNPWGQNFTPNGPDGPERGYATDHGIFQMPLPAFYALFSSVHLETFSRAIVDDGPIHGVFPP